MEMEEGRALTASGASAAAVPQAERRPKPPPPETSGAKMIKGLSALAIMGLLAGCALSLASLVTSYWITFPDGSHTGLFAHCLPTGCVQINFTLMTGNTEKGKQGQFKAVRGLIITGLITGVCGFLMATGFVIDALRNEGVKSLALLRSSLVLNPIAGIIDILAGSVFVSTLYKTALSETECALNFSFLFCMAGGASLVVCGILVYIAGPRKVTLELQEAEHRTLCRAAGVCPERATRQTRVTMYAAAPPPHYSPPTEQYIAQYQMPPGYDEPNSPPPEYYDDDDTPPPYDA